MTTTTLKAELMAVLGCKKESSIYPRLKAIGLLATCGRCGGGGQYSYCAMHGTTCFGCSGAGLLLPKFTAALVAKVRELWTVDFAAAYVADQKQMAECQVRVKAARGMYLASVVVKEWSRIAKAADVKGWMQEAEFMETNHASLNAARNTLYKIQQRIDAALVNVVGGKMWVKELKKYVPCDWGKLDAVLAPHLAEFASVDML